MCGFEYDSKAANIYGLQCARDETEVYLCDWLTLGNITKKKTRQTVTIRIVSEKKKCTHTPPTILCECGSIVVQTVMCTMNLFALLHIVCDLAGYKLGEK